MVKFIAKRLAISVVLLFIVTTLVFAFVHMMPGDPVLTMLGVDSNPDPVTVEKIRTELGLDQPILVQYGNYLKGIVKLDLGKSYSEKIPVVQAIASRFPRTLELAFVSLVLACLAGIPLGIIAAIRRGKLSDLMLTTVASVGTSVPVYVLGYLLVVVFALNIFNLPIAKLPASGFTAFSKDPAMHIQKIILPAVTLALGVAASIMRTTRSSMLDAMAAESIRPLRAKGLSGGKVIRKHVIRNAMIPVITIIGLQLGNLIGGTVLCETVFNWPGVASLLVKAINHRDYPLIQGCVLLISVVYIFTNMMVDIIYGILDPRVR